MGYIYSLFLHFLPHLALWYMCSADISALSFYCLRLWLCILHPMVCNQMADTLILTHRKILFYFWATGLILVRTMSRVSHISRRLSLSALFHVYQCFCANCESALQVLNLIMIFFYNFLSHYLYLIQHKAVINWKPPEFNHLYLTHYHTNPGYHHFLQEAPK